MYVCVGKCVVWKRVRLRFKGLIFILQSSCVASFDLIIHEPSAEMRGDLCVSALRRGGLSNIFLYFVAEISRTKAERRRRRDSLRFSKSRIHGSAGED